MSDSLTISAAFPTGSFHGHIPDGRPEWPPHPARLAAAVLSAGYHTRTVDIAETLFGLPPPTISTPPATPRDTDWARWVPVDPTLDVSRGKPTIGRHGKLLKPPERGMAVPADRPITYTFETPHGFPDGLRSLLHAVPYLGRPTSPVLLDLHALPPVPTPDRTMWTPDPLGQINLRVASPQLLAALNEREGQRRRPGSTPHPPLTHSSDHPYSHHSGAPPGHEATPAPPGVVHAVLNGMIIYRTPHATPADLPGVVAALDIHTGIAVPITGELSSGGRSVPRLFGMAVTGEPVKQDVIVIINGTLAQLRVYTPKGTLNERTAVANTWGTSPAWTTTSPVPADGNQILTDTRDLASQHRAHLSRVTTHQTPRNPYHPNLPHRDDLTHISVAFDRPIHGPLTLAGPGVALEMIRNTE